MKRIATIAGIVIFGIVMVLIPIAYRSLMSVKYRNFRTVTPGVLYRSGQMSESGFADKAREHGFKTVVSLREFRDKAGALETDHSEVEYCRKHGIKHIILMPAQWHREEGEHAPVEQNLKDFLAIMAEPKNHPVLVHCFAGIHRTGGYVALYRMTHDGWTAEEAITEMKTMGTPRTVFDADTSALIRHLEVSHRKR